MFLRDTSEIANRVAIVDDGGNQFTYGELEDLSLRYKAVIPERNLVVILCDYSIETVSFYYCQMMNHVVPILVDKKLRTDLISRIIEKYEPQFIWCFQNISDKISPFVKKVIIQSENYLLIQTSFRNIEKNPDLALLLTTSGSTGSSKMVRLSYDNLRCHANAAINTLDFSSEDRGITTLPMFHCYGLSVLHMHWMIGASIYLTEYSVLNTRFWDFFEKAQITNFAGVPYLYDMLKQIGFLDNNYKSLRFLTQAGAKFSDEQQKEFGRKLQEKGIKLYLCYGQTETTSWISRLSCEKILQKIGSVGNPVPGAFVTVENPNDKGKGEIVCRGQSICLGYANDKQDLIRSDDNLGCLYTGDIGYIDEDGDIFIRGRKARFVKLLGERVSLDELEILLSKHFETVQFICTGEDDELRIYYLAEDCPEEKILEFCSRELSIPRRLVKCYFINEIPYTKSGKIRYADLSK